MEGLLRKAIATGAEQGAMAAYDQLRGQHRYRGVAKHWGSAFFTKALYAGLWNQDHARPALILDEVLAKKVTILSDLPHLLYQGKGYNSSFYRYGVYLAWMGQTAVRFDVALEFLEYSLFKANLSN